MAVGLVGVVVRPLAGDGSGVDASVPHQLVGREGVVGVDVPVLHAPHEVDAAVVVGQHVGQVAPFIPVIVPLSAAEFCTGPGRQGVERADDVVGAHAQIIAGRIRGCAFVQGIVKHGTGLGGAVSIEHFLDANRARDGHDRLEVGRGLLCCFPVGCACVGLAHQADVAVRPLLLAQPVHDALNAGLFAQSLDVLAVGRLPCTKGRGLSECVAVRYEGVVHPLPHAAVRHRVGGGIVAGDAFTAEIVVGVDGHDHRNLRAFRYVGQPQRYVHQSRAWEPGVLFAGRKLNLNEVFLVRQDFVGAVFRELGTQGVHGEVHEMAVTQRRVPPFDREIRANVVGFSDRCRERHGEHQEGEGERHGGGGGEVQLSLRVVVNGLEFHLDGRGVVGHG